MSIFVYASTTSVRAGDTIGLHATAQPAGNATVRVVRLGAAETEVFAGVVPVGDHPTPPDAATDGCAWPRAIDIATSAAWRSGLYRATLTNDAQEHETALFVVRPAAPTGSILACVPFATFNAYGTFGSRNLYGNEDPNRANKLSFDRPILPPTTGNEDPYFSFFDTSGFAVDYCSSLDLHALPDLLSSYQLLVSIGHDEYWSAEMRQAVETFVAQGGNAAFFSANTCWWQVRFEDGDRTMVCHKNALLDPITATQPHLATTRWFSAPVFRPENSMTGVSFRYGAGCWVDSSVMAQSAYTTRFADHWVFEGTNLANGQTFARGCVGYETDAADFEDTDGIPWATGRDGAPPGFAILATADLTDWRKVGQGGFATMGIYTQGGTVFTAASVGWGVGLAQPGPVAQITHNVIQRLARPWPAGNWEVVGEANHVVAMTAIENRLFAAADGRLWWRPPVAQNLHWTDVGAAVNVVAMAAPTEATGNLPVKLFALTSDGGLMWRDPVITGAAWERIADAPDVTTLAAINNLLFAGAGTELRCRDATNRDAAWIRVGDTPPLSSMTSFNGRLFAATADRRVLTRDPAVGDVAWDEIGSVPGDPSALAGFGSRLFVATGNKLLWAIPGATGVGRRDGG